jgi:hypothetical protein
VLNLVKFCASGDVEGIKVYGQTDNSSLELSAHQGLGHKLRIDPSQNFDFLK